MNRDEAEERRFYAAVLLQAGAETREVARLFGVTYQAVRIWRKLMNEPGALQRRLARIVPKKRQPDREAMESRRLEAEELIRAGASQTEVARKLGVSRISASRWQRRMLTAEGMKANKATGRPARLSQDQLRQLWETQTEWRGREFAEAVFRQFGVHYDEDYCYRVFDRLRGSA